MSTQPHHDNELSSSGAGRFSRRKVLATMLGVPVVLAAGSSASAFGQALQGSSDATSPRAAQDAADVLASLRFGMFVHFNPSSVVGREIGWGRNAYRPGEAPGNQYSNPSVKTDPVYDTAYRNFLPEADWATKLAASAKAAGMTYLVFTTKHHDGYPNFRADNVNRSAYPDYADTPMGRSGRDLTREVAEAARAAGLKVGFYYSQRDWTQPDYGKDDYGSYYGYMMEHIKQLLTKYGKVDFLWYDSIPYADRASFRPPSLFDTPRELQSGLVINDRAYSNMGFQQVPPELQGDFSTPEGKTGEFNVTRPWESCISVTPENWSWVPDKQPADFATVIKTLASCVTRGGSLLLNVPPMKTGYLEDRVTATLRQVGDYMAHHKEAFVGTRGGPYRNSDVGGATYRDSTVYVHITPEVRSAKLRLPRIAAKVTSAATLGGRSIPFSEGANGEVLVDMSGYGGTGPDFVVKLGVDRALTVNDVTSEGISWVA